LDSPILSSAQMRTVEEAAFARGVEVEALMDQAGAGVARTVWQFFANPGTCIVFAGKGHNGGDALVAAQHLKQAGWKIDIRLPYAENDSSELTRKKLQALRDTPDSWHRHPAGGSCHIIVLDGLLGIGAKSFLREPIRTAAREINRLRREQNAFVFAVDLPTGLDGNTGETDPEDSVCADFTVTIGFAKHGLIVDSALDFVGRLEVVPLPDLAPQDAALNDLAATAPSLRALCARRKFDAYKNQFGRIGVVAGSKGFIGAALMSTRGTLRAGAGLVEVFVPEEIYEVVASAAPVESMVKSVRSYKHLLNENVEVWAVGPGLGKARAGEILQLIESAEQPMVVDADALNILAEKVDVLRRCRGPRLLTPHPGEMARLVDVGKMSRAGVARNFTDEFPVTLLYKGSRTVVCEKNRPISYNTTGNPGMASGGMGDVLTGVCAGLMGRKLAPYDAARVGAWVCGRAAEIAVFRAGASEESLLAGDVLNHLGTAFNELRDPIV
jgi:ADP-dependent NAD(P)H-hydrate dehydratase / NAD(P)H-hydrate epimerase